MAVLNPSTSALIPCSTGERLDISIVSAREKSEGECKREAGGVKRARRQRRPEGGVKRGLGRRVEPRKRPIDPATAGGVGY